MKDYKQLVCGILIGSFASAAVVFAGELRTYLAEEASYPVVVDDSPISLDMPIVTIEGRTYLPLRAMGDVLGVDVQWNDEKRQAEVSRNTPPSATPSSVPSQDDEVVTADGVVHYDRIKYETIDGEEYIKPIDADKIMSRKWGDESWILSWSKATDLVEGNAMWCFLATSKSMDDRMAINIPVVPIERTLYISKDTFENYVLKSVLDKEFEPDWVNTVTVELPRFTPDT